MRPLRLRLFGDAWRVVYAPKTEPSEQLEYTNHGRTDYEKRLIVVGSGGDKTLLHELIHVVDETLRIGLKEKQIEQLENGLWAILRDNPKLLRKFSS